MTNYANKAGKARAERSQVIVGKTDILAGAESTTPLAEGTMPPIPAPKLPTSGDRAASVHTDSPSPAPGDTAPNEPTQDENSATKGDSKVKTAKNPKGATGPKSEAGKRRSSCNSLKHGLNARRLFATPQQWAEDGAEYRAIAIGVNEYYRPEGFWEAFWAEQIVTHAVRLARGIGFQEVTLSSVYRFGGTSLNTSQRHVSGAFKHLLQATEKLEAIQAKRKSNSSGSDREHVSEASESPSSSASESVAGCADENGQQGDLIGSQGTVDANHGEDEEDDGFLFDGSSLVSPREPDYGAVSTAQSTKIAETKSADSPQPQTGAWGWRKAASAHPLADLADLIDEINGIKRESELVPSVAQNENVETNSTAVVKEPTLADSQEDKR
jgi:hypothetical protein